MEILVLAQANLVRPERRPCPDNFKRRGYTMGLTDVALTPNQQRKQLCRRLYGGAPDVTTGLSYALNRSMMSLRHEP